MPTLYLMMGYPGAGKTTASKAIHELTGAVHLWADQERLKLFGKPRYTHAENLELYGALNRRTDELLGQGQSVIFDTNFNFYKDRQRLRQIAAKNQADTKLLWLKTPKGVALSRATNAAAHPGTRVLGDMPLDRFNRMTSNLEPPHTDESYIEVDGTKITPDYIKQLLG